MKSNRYLWIGIAFTCCLANESLALDPAAWEYQGAAFEPTLGVVQRYYDNYLYQSYDEQANDESVVNAGLAVELERSKTAFEADFSFSSGRFREDSQDNYDDFGLAVALSSDFTVRNHAKLFVSSFNFHEARGTGFSKGQAALILREPDTYRSNRYGLFYRYGALSARGRIELTLAQAERRWTSRREVTAQRDYESPEARAAFYLRVGSSTDVLFEVRGSETRYSDEVIPNRVAYNSKEHKIYTGISWEFANNTEGSIKLGQAAKNFDSPVRDDFSGLSWEASASWAPKTYSIFSLSTTREPRETDGTGSFIEAQLVDFSWAHSWNSRVTTNWSVRWLEEDYQGAEAARNETLAWTKFGIDYAIKRWFDIGFSVSAANKSATIAQYEYEANTAQISAAWSL